MNVKIREINNKFISFFSKKGYIQMQSVQISSGIDDSVTYIGSGISVLKPIFLNDNIHSIGNFILQDAIRTQSLKNIYEECISEFSSFFEAMCVLVKYENLENLVLDSFEFFEKELEIPSEKLMLRISSRDNDLINSTLKLSSKVKVEIDSKEKKYYNHKYGLDSLGIFGRNMNFAFWNKNSKKYEDVGNIIVIQSKNKIYGVELALGTQAILMRKYGIPTSIEANEISKVVELDSPAKYKYAECLVVVSNLAKEEVILKKKKRYPIYLYKKYLKALKYWAEKLNFSNMKIRQDFEKYQELKLNIKMTLD